MPSIRETKRVYKRRPAAVKDLPTSWIMVLPSAFLGAAGFAFGFGAARRASREPRAFVYEKAGVGEAPVLEALGFVYEKADVGEAPKMTAASARAMAGS